MKEIISVIIPVYNEAECLPETARRVLAVSEQSSKCILDIIFVNDGSQDGSSEQLQELAARFQQVKVVSLSRNFGHQKAVSAGLRFAEGDYVVIMDADLQDPPEFIEAMYDRAKSENADVVYGQRRSRKGDSFFKRLTAHCFYRVLSTMCSVEIPKDTGDFRLISKKVCAVLNCMPEQHRFLRGMVPWVGFKSVAFLYDREERWAGTTKYPLKKMLLFAADAILSFSNIPLRFMISIGLFCIIAGFGGGALILFLKFFTELHVPGITAVILTMVIMGGVQIMMLGISGEYIGRIFEQSKRRPLYIVDFTCNLNHLGAHRSISFSPGGAPYTEDTSRR